MSKPQADVTFTAVVLLLAVLGLVFGGWLIADPLIPLGPGPDILAMNPRVFPTLILAATALVAFIFLAMEGKKGAFSAIRKTRNSAAGSAALYRQVLFILITVGCALLLTTLGFLTTMFLIMASTSVLVGNRSVFQVLTISLVLPLSFYIIVTHVLRTALPELDIVERTLAPIMQLLPTV